MANCVKAFFVGQRLLRQVFENSNVMQMNRYYGNAALLSNFSDFHTILGAETMNERLSKSFFLQQRSFSKYDAFKTAYIDANCTRLSNLNGNIVKTGKKTPILKPTVAKYFDLCTKVKPKKDTIRNVTDPPKSRQTHAYFLQRSLFNYSTPFQENKAPKKQHQGKTIENIKKDLTMSIGAKPNAKEKNKVAARVKAAIHEEPKKDIPKRSSVHTIYRKDWGRSPSLDSDSSRTNLNNTLFFNKYKDLSVLCDAPSSHSKVTQPRSKKETPASHVTPHIMRMDQKHEVLDVKNIIKVNHRKPFDLKDEKIAESRAPKHLKVEGKHFMSERQKKCEENSKQRQKIAETANISKINHRKYFEQKSLKPKQGELETENSIEENQRKRFETNEARIEKEKLKSTPTASVPKRKECKQSAKMKSTSQNIEVFPRQSPIDMHCSVKDGMKNADEVSKPHKDGPFDNSRLRDLYAEEVYAETWMKTKLNNILKVPEFQKPSPVKTKSEAIYLPELRELNPYEFYDFHANFRPIKKKATNTLFTKAAKIQTKAKPNLAKLEEDTLAKNVEIDKERQDAGHEPFEEENPDKNCSSQDLKLIINKEPKPLKNEIPKYCRIPATYLWVNGDELSIKDRILTKAPKTVRDLPEWTSSESDTSKNTKRDNDCALIPKQYYKNPFKRKDESLIILCDVQNNQLQLSKRASCLKTVNKYIEEEPWFSFAQEYLVLNMDGRPLCWNKAKEAALAKDLAKAHVDACLYAGLPFIENNEQNIPGKWEYQIGPAFGINAADDLWVSRYLLKRLAEQKNVQVSFDPKCLPRVTMDISTRVNFSTESMRKDKGLKQIMNAVNRLEESHLQMSTIYKQRRNKNFSWAIENKNASVRIPLTTAKNGRGYIQDRRPAGDCDPYEITEAIIKTCLKAYKNESTA